MNRKSLCRILFLASDPTDIARLRLGEEQREIQEKLQLAKFRNKFEFHSRMSVRPVDISQALLDIAPQVLHFSGHGTYDGGLCFEDLEGKAQIVTPDALASLFELVSENVDCVLLNACYSEAQANAIVQHINYVIGMNQAIGDKAAIAFAIGFYQALGAGQSVEQSYRFGCAQVRLQGIPEHLTPILKIKKQIATSESATSNETNTNEDEHKGGGKPDSNEKARNKLKFFYYISKQKVDMLSSQLQLPSSDSDAKSLVANTRILIDNLKASNNIVSLTDHKTLEAPGFIEDRGSWRQGLYSFFATGEEVVTYVCWKALDSVLVLLVGSPNNILGEKVVRDGMSVPGTSGALMRVLRFINNEMKTDEPRAVSLEPLPFYGSYGNDHNTHALAEGVVELSKAPIESLPSTIHDSSGWDFPNVERLCSEYLQDLPLTRIETIFKIYSTFNKTSDTNEYSGQTRTNRNFDTVFIGSPLYIAID